MNGRSGQTPVEAERQQSDALTTEVKRLIAKSRSQPTAAGAELYALGEEAIGILCSLAQAERKRRNGWHWFFSGLTLVGWIAILILPKGQYESYRWVMKSLCGIVGLSIAAN